MAILSSGKRNPGMHGAKNSDPPPPKSAAADAAEAETYLQTIISASHDAILVVDSEGRFEFGNEAFFRTFGWPKEELIGHHFIKVVPPASHEHSLQRWDEVQRGEGTAYEVDIVTQQGQRRSLLVSHTDVDVRGRRKYCVVVKDVTEHKRAEASLRREKAFSDTIIDSIPGLFYVLDDQGRFVRWNRAGEELTGLSPKELHGMDALATIHEDDRELVADKMREVFEKGQARAEARALGKKGVRHFLLTGQRMVVDDKTYLVGSGIDITARQRARDSLKRINEQLEQRVEERTAELTEAIDQLNDEVLQRTRAELALRREQYSLEHLLQASDQDRRMIAYEIHDGLAQHLAGAIMQLELSEQTQGSDTEASREAFFAGMQSLRQSHSEARRLISGVRPPILDESGILAALAHLIHGRREDEGPQVEFRSQVDFERLDPVLENAIFRIVQEALANACEHSGSDRVVVELVQQGYHLQIEVRDWGVGFDPDAVGEGCFGVEGILQRARLLGGNASIDSAEGQGTRVVVRLPIVVPERSL